MVADIGKALRVKHVGRLRVLLVAAVDLAVLLVVDVLQNCHRERLKDRVNRIGHAQVLVDISLKQVGRQVRLEVRVQDHNCVLVEREIELEGLPK